MEICNRRDVGDYLTRKKSFLLHYGRQQLPDAALVEDAIQELVAWTLVQVNRGRVFNDSYLFQRFRSLLRDARREGARVCPEQEQSTEVSLDRRLDSQRVLDRIAEFPDGELVVDGVELGAREAARLHGRTLGAVYVRIHRFRKRLLQEFPEGIAA